MEFEDDELDELETDPRAGAGYSPAVVKKYRKIMQAIRSASDPRPFVLLRRFGFEKLKGDRSHQSSFKLDQQLRLIVEFEGEGRSKTVRVIEIVDYH